MKIHRTPLALTVTALWIFGALIYAYQMRVAFIAMTPSQFAEFLAGAFSPLAFLWLIFGYMQQGQELEQNTEALKLQAFELRQSAEQQRHLVEVTREQLMEERNYYKEERERMLAASEPVFLIGQDGAQLPNVPNRYIRIANSGGTARALSLIVISPNGNEERVFTVPLLDTGAHHDFHIPDHVLRTYKLRFTYRTIHGLRGRKEFTAEVDAKNIPQFSLVES